MMNALLELKVRVFKFLGDHCQFSIYRAPDILGKMAETLVIEGGQGTLSVPPRGKEVYLPQRN